MIFKVGNYVVNIDAARLGEEDAEKTLAKDLRFSEKDTLAFVNHVNARFVAAEYGYKAMESLASFEHVKEEFNELFEQLGTYGYFCDELKEIYSRK